MTEDTAANTTYLVLLYMALGRHEEAAEVAVGLARRAQEAGNYKACPAPCPCPCPICNMLTHDMCILFVISTQCASWGKQPQSLCHQPALNVDIECAVARPMSCKHCASVLLPVQSTGSVLGDAHGVRKFYGRQVIEQYIYTCTWYQHYATSQQNSASLPQCVK